MIPIMLVLFIKTLQLSSLISMKSSKIKMCCLLQEVHRACYVKFSGATVQPQHCHQLLTTLLSKFQGQLNEQLKANDFMGKYFLLWLRLYTSSFSVKVQRQSYTTCTIKRFLVEKFSYPQRQTGNAFSIFEIRPHQLDTQLNLANFQCPLKATVICQLTHICPLVHICTGTKGRPGFRQFDKGAGSRSNFMLNFQKWPNWVQQIFHGHK